MFLDASVLWAKRYVPDCPHTIRVKVDNIGGEDWVGPYGTLKCITCGKLDKDYGKDKESY